MTRAAADPDPEPTRRQADHLRADPDVTAEDFRRRRSPGALLDEALRGRGGAHGATRLRSALGRALREKPAAVVLIGVGLAWLALAAAQDPPPRRRAMPLRRHDPGRPQPEVDREVLMAVSRENLIEWLRDARAMEDLAIETLDKQAGRQPDSELRRRLEAHLEESRRQAERIDACLVRLGGSTAVAEPTERGLPGEHQLAELFKGGTMIQNGIIDYTFEHFEIATYRALLSAAEEAGEAEVGQMCRQNLAEEEAMAAWLAQHLPQIARQYLRRQALERLGRGTSG